MSKENSSTLATPDIELAERYLDRSRSIAASGGKFLIFGSIALTVGWYAYLEPLERAYFRKSLEREIVEKKKEHAEIRRRSKDEKKSKSQGNLLSSIRMTTNL